MHRREGNRAKDLAVPTSAEVKEVLAAAQPGYRSGFAVMASTGLRYQELMLLAPEDVQDVNERQPTRRILIRPKVVGPGEHRNLPCGGRWMPKGAEQRTIEVRANVLAAAREWVEWKNQINSRGFWFGAWEACQCCGTTTRPHMGRGLCARCYKRLDYHARRGTLDARQTEIWEAPRRSADLSVKGLNRALVLACEAAGVPAFTIKVFRDFRITTLDQERWSLEDIRRYIGHASIRTTEGYVKPTRGRPLPTSVLDL